MFQQNTPTEKQSSRSASFLRPGICAGEHAVAWCHLRVPSHSASRSPCCKLLVCGVAGSVMTHEFLFFIPSCSTSSLVGWLVGWIRSGLYSSSPRDRGMPLTHLLRSPLSRLQEMDNGCSEFLNGSGRLNEDRSIRPSPPSRGTRRKKNCFEGANKKKKYCSN
jgi:hypothetical protein